MKYLLAAVAALLSTAAGAQTYIEGDAGQTLTTFADTTTLATGTPLTTINGTLTGQDADLFRIYISAPGMFLASTNNAITNNSYTGPGGGALDTALFLFDQAGHAIATNDDADGLALTSTLSTASPLLQSLTAGYYFLGIGISGNEPVNSANNLLFAMGGTTDTRGPAGNITPTTLFDFDRNAYDAAPGAYSITLNGVSAGPAVAGPVPEPAGWALMVGGFGLLGAAMRRRRVARPLAA